jgi:hypothetical protein
LKFIESVCFEKHLMAAASGLEGWEHAELQFQELENRAALALALQELRVYEYKECAKQAVANNEAANRLASCGRACLLQVLQASNPLPVRKEAADKFHKVCEHLKLSVINSYRTGMLVASTEAVLDELTRMYGVLERDKAMALQKMKTDIELGLAVSLSMDDELYQCE